MQLELADFNFAAAAVEHDVLDDNCKCRGALGRSTFKAAASMYMIFTRRGLKAQNFELHLSDRAARADDETRNGSKAR